MRAFAFEQIVFQEPAMLPWQLQVHQRLPWLRRIPARIIGMGFRPELPDIQLLNAG